jgi:hypothetical protein
MAEELQNIEQDEQLGKIVIDVSQANINYDTNFSLAETVFWLDVAKSMIMARVLGQDDGNGSNL